MAQEFRRVVNVAGAGSHLRALLRSFSGLVPAAARFSIDDVLPQERAALHDEYAAIHAGDVAAAGDASLAHLRLTADNAVRALRCRGRVHRRRARRSPVDGRAADPGGAMRRTRGTLVIDKDRCKGCELCLAACPPDVLAMSSDLNELGYRYPELQDGCTGCTAGQVVCPDFVFTVYRYAQPHVPPTMDA